MNTFIQFSFLIGLLLVVITLARILFFYFITIKKWQQVQGLVIQSKLVYFNSGAENEGWRRKITYKYTINSIDYENDCVTKNITMFYPSQYMAKEFNYKNDQEITVTYNPQNPQESILDSKFNPSMFIIFLLFSSFIYTVFFIFFN
jgi:hypothetical protein